VLALRSEGADPVKLATALRLLLAPVALCSLVACHGSSPTPMGGVDQSCYPNETCNAGLSCLSDLCVQVDGSAVDGGPPPEGGAVDASMDGPYGVDAADGSMDTGSSVPEAGCEAGALLCAGTCVDPATDPDNCGACGHDCLGLTCQGAGCQPVVLTTTSGGGAYSMVVDSQNVYWTDFTSGTVCQVSNHGGSAQIIAMTAMASPTSIAVDTSYVYWADTANSQIQRTLIGGGLTVPVYTGPPGPFFFSLGSGTFYFSSLQSGGIYSVPLDGGAATELTPDPNEPSRVTADSSNVYWVDEYGNSGNSTVVQMPLDGGAIVQLASGQDDTRNIVVDSTYAYWVSAGGGVVDRAPIGGGSSPVQLVSGLNEPFAIAIDGSNAYFTTQGGGQVMSVPKSGGNPTVIASGLTNPEAVALDAQFVYWGTYGNNGITRIYKAVKP
jgi:hypothetical protein